MKASGLVLALTTEANAERAQQLAEALLERHLVACVSIHPVQSFYRWEGSLQASHEVQLLMKTSAQHVDALRSAVSELHSYDTPEWLCCCLLYTSPSPRDLSTSRMPSSA